MSREVIAARFRYRHEAELAAGFLADAGIPYRLQSDDAGGTVAIRPAVLWVRESDLDEARELIGGDQEDALDTDEAGRGA
jgi:hypothetical protein